MEQRKCVTNIPVWVRTDSNHNILFEGSYSEAMNFNKGNFMSKEFYEQYREEVCELRENNS